MIDPFRMWERLSESYQSYLCESFPIHQSQPKLRELFSNAIRGTQVLTRPPMISMIPRYVQNLSPDALMTATEPPRLDSKLKKLTQSEFSSSRPLYKHQVQAVQRIQQKRNVVVATGTGSGKTEAFLLPVLDYCVRTKGKGVQALLVYPMNALANDQLGRLRKLLGDTGITIGRYTGQTPENMDEIDESAQDEIASFERATREDIRENPPQILLTNFAMLEYLLLRPNDQTLFSTDSIQYVILDEAHTYRGSQAIDVSLLMRRLRQRFSHNLQFILTSATLGDPKNPDNQARIAKFASDLTGVDFDPSDVITGEVADPFQGVTGKELSVQSIDHLAELSVQDLVESLKHTSQTQSLLKQAGIAHAQGANPHYVLYESLRQLAPMRRFYELLRKEPCELDALAAQLSPDQSESAPTRQAQKATMWLLAAASIATPEPKKLPPLLSIRLHHFFRGFSGVSVLLNNAEGTIEPQKIYLEKKDIDDVDDLRTGIKATGKTLLPLRACAHCGMPVVAIKYDHNEGIWSAPILSNIPENELQLLTWFDTKDFDDEEQDDEEEQASPVQEEQAYKYLHLCMQPDCRKVGQGSPAPCGCSGQLKLLRIVGADTDGLKRCPCCAGERRPYPSVLRDFTVGEDAPTALLAEEILRSLPAPDNSKYADKPAQGRQLIAFSDARQRAAFFYPYLARTSAEPSYIQPLVMATRALQEEDLLTTPQRVLEKAFEFVTGQPCVLLKDTQDDVEYYKYIKTRLGREERAKILEALAAVLYEQLAATGRVHTKLPGLCLLGVDFDIEDNDFRKLAEKTPELFKSPGAGRDAVYCLLQTLIRTHAVAYWPNTVNRRKVLGMNMGPNLVTVHRGARSKENHHNRLQWNPFEAIGPRSGISVQKSNRASILKRAAKMTDASAKETLNHIWDWMIDKGRVLHEHPKHPGEYQLPWERMLITTRGPWFRCRKCSAYTRFALGGTCSIHGCSGTVEPISDQELAAQHKQSHRVKRFTQDPMPLSVREHTAQISLEEGKRIQQDFMNKDVNVLSSSTTFEMGVDVGQLEAVLLRNIPPTAANYIQRAGRAGRRLTGAAHAISFARMTPHDQYHFHKQRDIIAGSVPVPTVYVENQPITQRHINSLLLGRFFWDHKLPTADPRLEEFFPSSESLDGLSVAEKFIEWSKSPSSMLMANVASLASRAALDPVFAVERSIQSLINTNPESECAWRRGFLDPLHALDREYSRLQAERKELEDDRKLSQAKAVFGKMQRINDLISQLKGDRLISMLAACGWLPSYAFPQDTVQLQVLDANYRRTLKLERNRERAISEYAPQSEVIADGKMFTSVAVNLFGRTPNIKAFRFCEQTRRVGIELDEDTLKKQIPQVGSPRSIKGGRFIEPKGFLTDIEDDGKQPNLYRNRPPANSQLYVVDSIDASGFETSPQIPVLASGIFKNAKLFTANLGTAGQKFLLCVACGAATDERNVKFGAHRRPFGGKSCSGHQERVALANIFTTDVLQVRIHASTIPPVTTALGKEFWATLAAAIARAACEQHKIDYGDLTVTYRSISESDHRGELLLFDNVPGGAGFVQLIQKDLLGVFNGARDVLRNCPNKIDCGMDSSCYACLRSFNNQFHWDSLKRSSPLTWLDALCENK